MVFIAHNCFLTFPFFLRCSNMVSNLSMFFCAAQTWYLTVPCLFLRCSNMISDVPMLFVVFEYGI